MRRPRIHPVRNKIDLSDPVQVRIVTKRLRVSPSELTSLVGRIGNSIAAIAKEVHQQRGGRAAVPAEVPHPALIAAVTQADAAADAAATSDPIS